MQLIHTYPYKPEGSLALFRYRYMEHGYVINKAISMIHTSRLPKSTKTQYQTNHRLTKEGIRYKYTPIE